LNLHYLYFIQTMNQWKEKEALWWYQMAKKTKKDIL